MPINFPDSPSADDTYTINGRVYVWTGSKWRRQRPAIASASPSMSVSNDFSAGGSALHVDSTNSSVGIGTSSPNASESLTVGGDTSITGNLSVTGIITVPTQVSTTNDTKVATTEFVQTAISNLIGGAPAALDTLNELAAAINDDSSYAASITSAISLKQDSSTALTTSTAFGGDVSGTYNAIVVADDSHNHTIANVDNLQTTLDGKAASSHSHSNYVTTTNNSTLNSDSRNTRGPTRLYRRDSNSNYSVQTYWTGSRWRLYGYNGDNNHADTHVGYADSAGNADTVDGYHASSFHINSYSNDVTCDSTYADNWLRPTGSTGLYFESRGGGWYMTDSSWVRVYNSKHLYTQGGKFEARHINTSNDWSNQSCIITSSTDHGYAARSYDGDSHTGQIRPASGAFYVRNHNDGAYWYINAIISNQSSRRLKQDIETWGVAKPLSSAVNATYDTTATDIVKQLRPVTYRLKKHERLPRDIPNERRHEALDRLNRYRIDNDLEQYDGEEAIHECGRDCDGTPEQPCVMYANWDRGTIGFIAEEVGEVIPEATDMEVRPRAHNQGENTAIDGLALTAVLTKAIQEIEARLSALESA